MLRSLCGILIGGIVMSLPLPAVGEPRVDEVIEVSRVWAGHPVGFALLTHGDQQYVGYYDSDRQMIIAQRTLAEQSWTRQPLPTHIGWDSHNYIAMAIDDDGHLHVSGNMHNVPLIYFRTTAPGDVTTLEQVPNMTGQDERRVTYPRFFRGPASEFIFTYREGGSGRGNQIYNVYDHASRTWRRLLDEPLIDGRSEMNAYPHGPSRGPDGYFHLVWVWRNTPDCATNHSLSYARSRDLVNWETSRGEPIALPMTIDNCEIVDPVPPGGGIINGNARFGFDRQNRVILSYHKFDENGHTQIYNARLEDGQWRFYQTSDWSYRWEFSGGGSIPFEIRVGNVSPDRDGGLAQSYTHPEHGSGIWRLDEETLKPIGQIERPRARPAALEPPETEFEGIQVRWQNDSGRSGERGVRYVLRWETLGVNRDRPREGQVPEPTMLRLYRLTTNDE